MKPRLRNKIPPVIATEDNLLALQWLPSDTPIHAYKVIQRDGRPVYQYDSEIRYRVGRRYEELQANQNVAKDCGTGLHVATKAWCRNSWGVFDRPLESMVMVEFFPHDIAAVPFAVQDAKAGIVRPYGKFRVFRFKIIERCKGR
jgi:hypothetical protein